MLILTRKKDEKLIIGENIELWIVDIRGDTVKIGIKAPKDVKVYRQEVYQAIQSANKDALSSNLDKHPALESLDLDDPSKKPND